MSGLSLASDVLRARAGATSHRGLGCSYLPVRSGRPEQLPCGSAPAVGTVVDAAPGRPIRTAADSHVREASPSRGWPHAFTRRDDHPERNRAAKPRPGGRTPPAPQLSARRAAGRLTGCLAPGSLAGDTVTITVEMRPEARIATPDRSRSRLPDRGAVPVRHRTPTPRARAPASAGTGAG